MSARHTRSSIQGFTLLELSIVVVIIGLIVGGIVAGQEMIKTSENNKLLQEYQQIQQAVSAFNEKYRGLPGDFARASKYWPSEVNGNGDSTIMWSESDHAWRQLAKANLITGQYTGTGDIATSAQDSFASSINGTGWSFIAAGSGNSPAWFDSNEYGGKTLIMLGGFYVAYTANPTFTPARAYYLDKKVDDGLPYTGNVVGPFRDWLPDCGKGTTGNYTYNLTLNSEVCFMNFVLLEQGLNVSP